MYWCYTEYWFQYSSDWSKGQGFRAEGSQYSTELNKAMSSANTLTRHIVWTSYWSKWGDWWHDFHNSATYAYHLKPLFFGLILDELFRLDADVLTQSSF